MNNASCIWIVLLLSFGPSPSISAFVASVRGRIGPSDGSSCRRRCLRRCWAPLLVPTTATQTHWLGGAPRKGSWTLRSAPAGPGKHGERGSIEDDDDDDDGAAPPTAYGNRSLRWTERYRRALPYELARRIAMGLGLRGKEDWDDLLADGIVFRGPYLPTRPDEMYADDWVSWDEFLGVTRDHDDCRHIVRNVLRLRTMDEYRAFVAADVKRAEGLRIPALPDVVYRGRGWVDDDHFFFSNRS